MAKYQEVQSDDDANCSDGSRERLGGNEGALRCILVICSYFFFLSFCFFVEVGVRRLVLNR